MAFSKEGKGKPTPASGVPSVDKKPLGEEVSTAVAGPGHTEGAMEYPLRTDTAFSSQLPAMQVNGSEN